MKNKKHKILLLADFKDSVNTTLKSAVSLAKMMDGEISLFYVKKPTEVVKKDNQLSAIREINHEYTATNKAIKKLVESISKTFNISINYSFTIGNLKHEIANCIKKEQPDIIVIGKRKTKLLNLTGDKLANFILKYHSGAIMIADETNTILPDKTLSLGFFLGIEQNKIKGFAEHLMAKTQKPIKLFKIISNNTNIDSHQTNDDNVIEFIFEQNDNSIENLSNYLIKSKVNLLYISRAKNKELKQNINDIINKLNVSLFLSEKNRTTFA